MTVRMRYNWPRELSRDVNVRRRGEEGRDNDEDEEEGEVGKGEEVEQVDLEIAVKKESILMLSVDAHMFISDTTTL